MNKFDEMILVVKRDLLFDNEKYPFHGFLSRNHENYGAVSDAFKQFEVKRRGDMEEDPKYKQLVSYCVLVNENDEVLVYERLSGGGETRLHGNMSIGVGGHMNDVLDVGDISAQLTENAFRELEEEVGLNKSDAGDMEIIGLINDDTNEVGEVHIGIVFKVSVKSELISAVETDTLKINWQNTKEFGDLESYETWSALIIDELYES